MRNFLGYLFLGLFVFFSCYNKKSGIEDVEYLNLTPQGFFDEERHNIFLTEAKITTDDVDVFVSIAHQGLILRTDSLLNLISFINGRDSFPEFDFPTNLVVKDDELFVEELANQRVFIMDKENYKLISMKKFPISSMGIKIDISEENKLAYTIFPEKGKTGQAWVELEVGKTKTSKEFFSQEGKIRMSDQIRLGCFCKKNHLWSLGRFLLKLELLNDDGEVEKQFDLKQYEPLKRAFDTLLVKRRNIPDFESNRISQNIVTSLDCFDNKLLVGFTDLVGLDRSNVRHLLLFSSDEQGINLEKILRLKTGNEDELFHFQSVKYNPKTSLLYAQGLESNRIYVFPVNL
ncbi:hypothetical protein A33Q_0430 [Indibacter alkaliphilus LW1]|uniref:TolB-like 6-blade propeller-like n=1 Tax=Indibacter alkaliphilus (strain CCUG 57479 / KCTC 22604 / LW1) TaxID=1189612 RepID=S2DKW1_INDAL|nr:hypothetical protein A33Q_0430 [Indibacter alkaliphilus LW1]